jgi:mannosyltransferase OCH1-like enzyme
MKNMSVNSTAGKGQPIDGNRIIQGLWIGSRLSTMEQLSISSFLRHEHEYHLYAYNELANVPAGTVIKDANEILPASSIFQYKNRPSYAGFANYFRYKLLLERGGWWADADLVCLRPFDFPEEHVFSSELNVGHEIVNCGAIKAPKGSEGMAYACGVCQAKKPDQLVWGETGPRLVAEVVKKYRLDKYQKPYYIFCPISEWHKVLEPHVAIHPEAYAIHLWNEEWRLANQDKNGRYHRRCIYERLKATYLRQPTRHGSLQEAPNPLKRFARGLANLITGHES